ncbi:hypothetical protein DXG01_007795 [Tephrocybe rancida]|nr:hypothetical protein DXG01_007795 [Tephrocybe rancida]
MLSHLGPQIPEEPTANSQPEVEAPGSEGSPESNSLPETAPEHLSSSRNLFGLFKTYGSTSVPSHDPDQKLSLLDLQDALEDLLSSSPIKSLERVSPYYPYPNKQSFELGNWFWNHGIQKSQSSFKDLLAIGGAKDF